MADITLNQVNQTLLAQNKKQEGMAHDIAGLRAEFASYFKFLKDKALDDLETKRESGKKGAATGSAVGTAKKDDKGISGLKLLAGAAIVTAVAIYTALQDYFGKLFKMTKVFGRAIKTVVTPLIRFFTKITGLTKLVDSVEEFTGKGSNKIQKFFKDAGGKISAKLTKAFSSVTTVIDDMIKPIRNIFRNFTVGFTRIGTNATGIVDDVLKMEDFSTLAAKIGAGLKTAIMTPINFLFGSFKTADTASDFATIGNQISEFFKPIKSLFSVGEGSFFGKMVSTLKSAFSFLGEGSTFMKVAGSLGRIIGRLAWPITVIMGVVDAVTGAFSGFTNEDGTIGDKLLAGLKGGIAGLFKGLIGAPLDLIKSAVSWIIGKFGFKDAEKTLDSFSFTDLIHNLVMSPIEILKRAINSIIDGIAGFLDDSIIPGSGTVAKQLRSFKFDEGQTDSERIAAKEKEEARMKASVERYNAGLAARPINTGNMLSEEVAAQQKASSGVVATSVGQIGDTVQNVNSSSAYVGGGLNPMDTTRSGVLSLPTSF